MSCTDVAGAPAPPKPESEAVPDFPPQPDLPPTSEMLARKPETKGVFEARDDGAARHIQSGMICPRKLGTLNVWRFQVYPSPAGPGTDVGCDYGIQGLDDLWVCKLTLFAIKAEAGETADTAFRRYKDEVERAYPQAKYLGPAVTFKGETPAYVEHVRSAEYEIVADDIRYQSDLVVMLAGGWIFEIRGTGRMDVVQEEAAAAVSCLVAPSFALTMTADSIGTAE